jgi:hypothetical protein
MSTSFEVVHCSMNMLVFKHCHYRFLENDHARVVKAMLPPDQQALRDQAG